jgi:gamma-glutamylaminecyclotransferase
MTRIFVYGTLKRGSRNHRLLQDQRFVGAARTPPAFRLYQLDGYPGMVAAAEDGRSIEGEIWEVDAACLAKLDDLEGVAEGLYARGPIALLPPYAGETVEGYLYRQSVAGRRDLGTRFD